MELSIKSITLFMSILLTGLSAGLFYAWSVSVIPGTRNIADINYLETMQSINQAILNPRFFLIFFGSLIMLSLSSIQLYQSGNTFWIILAATISYMMGTVGVTAFGNVPLNNDLELIKLSELTIDQLSSYRQNYEVKWNKFHRIRAVFAVLSFVLSLAAFYIHSKQTNSI